MTFWLDAQLDPNLPVWLSSRHDVDVRHVRELGLETASDPSLYDAGRRFPNIVIVSKDSDFADLSRRKGPPPQILHLRCGNLTKIEMRMWLSAVFGQALQRLQNGEACVQLIGP